MSTDPATPAIPARDAAATLTRRNWPVAVLVAAAGLAGCGGGAGGETADGSARALQASSAANDAAAAPGAVTEAMVRHVGAPPRPDAALRIEVQPGLPATDEGKTRPSKGKKPAAGN
jgi:hypothetical protein